MAAISLRRVVSHVTRELTAATGGAADFPDPYTPSAEELEKYHRQWDGLADYATQEQALDWLFIGNVDDNLDIAVEGHTDNVPLLGQIVEDN